MINMVAAIKLNPTNYLPWRRQITHMAECFDLMGLLDGSTIPPSPSISSEAGVQSVNPAYTAWKMKDLKLLSVLYTSLSEEVDSEVIDSSTSRDTWVTLEGVFSSASRQHQLREELLWIRRGSSSVDDYGKKFKLLCDQLNAIGRPVDETDKSHWFLRGLGIQFAGFADTRTAFSPVPAFRDLLHQAKQYDLMLRAMDGPTTPVAFTADRRLMSLTLVTILSLLVMVKF
ncbi:hypothetical protein F511_05140 [Dorcoceras hygrometricum]|uniref:Retrotransposon Copia-like N-terminal domain-containing protein n=1 Tax=Dorcoceras hygrometricum TaxID=472368 RepID=A0A2Z7C1V2_9LAMI|nr:hypothetical protein F511_05140 [Dorcoceras hygrometricum]